MNQQWPSNPQTPHGAWEFHEHLIPDTPAKPLRIWMEVGDRDNFNPNVMTDNMHDWVVANAVSYTHLDVYKRQVSAIPANLVEMERIELSFDGCRPSVLPLNDIPVVAGDGNAPSRPGL